MSIVIPKSLDEADSICEASRDTWLDQLSKASSVLEFFHKSMDYIDGALIKEHDAYLELMVNAGVDNHDHLQTITKLFLKDYDRLRVSATDGTAIAVLAMLHAGFEEYQKQMLACVPVMRFDRVTDRVKRKSLRYEVALQGESAVKASAIEHWIAEIPEQLPKSFELFLTLFPRNSREYLEGFAYSGKQEIINEFDKNRHCQVHQRGVALDVAKLELLVDRVGEIATHMHFDFRLAMTHAREKRI